MLIIFSRYFRSKEEKEAARLAFEQKFSRSVKRIAYDSRLLYMDAYTQHGSTSTLLHSIAVSYFSCRLAHKFRLTYSEKELIRGALLHDYFLYDWHEKDASHAWHGFTHPGRALVNAKEDFKLTKREEDIIRKHMFPLTPGLPRYRESILVCLVDKWCSTLEVFKKDPYEDLRMKFLPAGA